MVQSSRAFFSLKVSEGVFGTLLLVGIPWNSKLPNHDAEEVDELHSWFALFQIASYPSEV